MSDKPILFSAAMVRALLDGRKTMTRRILTPHNAEFGSASREFWHHADFSRAWRDGRAAQGGEYLHVPCHADEDDKQEPLGVDCRRCDEMGWTTTVHRLWPKIVPGNRLWVREAWGYMPKTAYALPKIMNPHDGDMAAYFRADFDRSGKPGWRPSIHMPRWASRLTLIVTDVRVQRLQEISEEDARAEGIAPLPSGRFHCGFDEEGEITCKSPVTAFGWLWNSINGEDAWMANPWVAAYTFTVHKANIDALEPANAEASP